MNINKPIKTKFQIKCSETAWEQSLYLVGEVSSLGGWNINKAIKMITDVNTFPVWTSNKIDLIPELMELKYKYVILNKTGKVIKWEEFPGNRIVPFDKLDVDFDTEEISEIQIIDVVFGKNHEFNSTNQSGKKNSEFNKEIIIKKVYKNKSSQKEIVFNKEKFNQDYENIQKNGQNFLELNPTQNLINNLKSDKLESVDLKKNQLKNDNFVENSMKKISDSYEKPIPKISSSDTYKKNLKILIENNSKARTWKEKLQFINDMILKDSVILKTEEQEKAIFDLSSLSIISIYLFFLNSGQIKCAEDGTHFRPNHHANLAFSIYTFLLKNIDDNNSIVVRSILRNIPSFSDQYQATVPLTRIRDIAHRGDIPSDLKSEIKNKLQNKLHRSASPDDLKTCEYLIEKIKNGNYSQDFVKEFFIFYEELKEFFNALGVEKGLSRLKQEIGNNSNLTNKVNEFLTIKYTFNLNKQEKYENFINILNITTQLRYDINKILQDEISKIENNQQNNVNKTLLQLSSYCDMELESYLFTILSTFINILEVNDKTKEIKLDNYHESLFFDLSKICLRNLSISNIFIDETKFLEEDIEYFSNANKSFNREGKLLRIKAIFERCLNLCYSLNSMVLDSFSQASLDLGKSLDLNANSIKVYGEGFIRSHTIFQFSKIISLVINKIRLELNLSPYIIISPGNEKGLVLHVKDLQELEILIDKKYRDENNKLTVFLDEADGTEELPIQVKTVLLSHDLPQLSHLAIRARQNNALFLCVVNREVYENLVNKFCKQDKFIFVKGTNEFSVSLEFCEATILNSQKKNSSPKKIPLERIKINSDKNLKSGVGIKNTSEEVKGYFQDLSPNDLSLLSIDEADYINCGSKSTNIKKLLKVKEILEKNESFIKKNNSDDKNLISFKIPYSICIPFLIYEYYNNILMTNSDNPNSENPFNYNLIDTDDLVNLEKNSSFFREKFVENINSHLKIQTKKNKLENYLEILVNDIILQTSENVKPNTMNPALLAFRSSSNLEDLNKNAGAGLFDSILGIPSNKPESIKSAIIEVWSSLFTHRALISRRKMGISSKAAKMAILVQEMIHSEFSFVIHTCNPITKNTDEVFIELAIGLGETLASANQKGSPYRIVYNKKTDKCKIVNFCSFAYSYCINYDENYLKLEKENKIPKIIYGNKRICYKQEKLSNDENFINLVGDVLGRIGVIIEKNINEEESPIIPQDIEGAFYNDSFYIVQTRPQII